MKVLHACLLATVLLNASTYVAAQTPAKWATIDATATTPTLEAGQKLWTSINLTTQGALVLTLSAPANGLQVQCFRDGGGLDASPCVAAVVRDARDKKKIQITGYGLIRSADGSSTVMTPAPVRAKFTFIVF